MDCGRWFLFLKAEDVTQTQYSYNCSAEEQGLCSPEVGPADASGAIACKSFLYPTFTGAFWGAISPSIEPFSQTGFKIHSAP